MEELAGLLPSTVEVHAQQAAAVIAENHAVWVEHRDNLDDELGTDLLSFRVAGQQKVDEALDHVGGLTLTRVNSRGDENVLFVDLLARLILYHLITFCVDCEILTDLFDLLRLYLVLGVLKALEFENLFALVDIPVLKVVGDRQPIDRRLPKRVAKVVDPHDPFQLYIALQLT
jgi:hypothetical protein